MILDEGFRGINRYRIQEYLHLLAKSYDKFEEKERKTLHMARRVENVLKMSKNKDDRKAILSEIQKLQEHIKDDLENSGGDAENHPILEVLLSEIQELNRNLSMGKKKTKKRPKLHKEIQDTPFKDDKELSAILERIDKLKEEDILKN